MKKKLIIIGIIVLIIITLVLLYARFIGTSGLKINEYKIVNSNITNEYHGFKVVHIADIHYGSTINNKRLKKLVDKINSLKPDIVVLTGDLTDEMTDYNKEELINNLVGINARLGKYAVSGNHDYPIDNFNEIVEKSGFINLNNTYELIYDNTNQPIVISGVSSNISDTTSLNDKTDSFDKFINTINQEDKVYSILLMHEPDYIKQLNLENYDLILSGHSHNGQFNIPLIRNLYIPEGAKEYTNGHYKIKNTDLFVSNGVGTSWLKFRLFSRPSIDLYRLTNK